MFCVSATYSSWRPVMHHPAGGTPTLGKTTLGGQIGKRLRRKGPDPRWVDTILDLSLTWPLARLGLVSLFLVAALMEVLDFSRWLHDRQRLHPARGG